MAQHGYLQEYDEGWDRGDDRDRWRDEDRERGRQAGDRDWRDRERGRNFMFGDRNRDWERDRDEDREFRRTSEGRFEERGSRDFAGSRVGSDWERSPRQFSSRQDDHYLSWRNKQMDALDRDYAVYCREREAQFHEDFDSWRSRRHGNPEPLQAGMTQTGLSADPSGELQLTSEEQVGAETGPDPTATATLGTTGGGRR